MPMQYQVQARQKCLIISITWPVGLRHQAARDCQLITTGANWALGRDTVNPRRTGYRRLIKKIITLAWGGKDIATSPQTCLGPTSINVTVAFGEGDGVIAGYVKRNSNLRSRSLVWATESHGRSPEISQKPRYKHHGLIK